MARYVDSLYNVSSKCNFADLKCLRHFSLNLIVPDFIIKPILGVVFDFKIFERCNFIDYTQDFFGWVEVCNINVRKDIIIKEIKFLLILLSKVQGFNSLMIEPKFDYAYLPLSLKFFVYSQLIDGQKVLH